MVAWVRPSRLQTGECDVALAMPGPSSRPIKRGRDLGAMIDQLEAALRENRSLIEFLRRFDEMDLPDGWLVAGAIAQTVWNLSGGYPAERGIKDVDIVYYDPADLSAETEAARGSRIRALFAHLPVKLDIKNEARVHLWYEKVFGYSIEPYVSAQRAIASFPTTATAIGVRWSANGLECCAPYGLDDLFGMVVRPNKVQITRAIYEGKIARWRPLWPHLIFVPWGEDPAIKGNYILDSPWQRSLS